MRIFKFGGASVQDAPGIQNVVKVLETVGHQNTLLVVSAMGKTTNAMDLVVKNYFEDKSKLTESFDAIYDYHYKIAIDLFETKDHPVFLRINELFEQVKGFLSWNKSHKYSFVYDQVVGYGELISTSIISAYLEKCGMNNSWLDVRDCIKTDDNYREGTVNWELTQRHITEKVDQSQ